MERIEVLKENYTDGINPLLKEGWKVKMICPFTQTVSKGDSFGHAQGTYGAYIVLTKTNNECIWD